MVPSFSLAKNHEISVYFSNLTPTDINLVFVMSDKGKTFTGSSVLDLRVL